MSDNAARIQHDGDEGYDGQPIPCIVCYVETVLRCGGCREPVCHNCEECPNGCDSAPPHL